MILKHSSIDGWVAAAAGESQSALVAGHRRRKIELTSVLLTGASGFVGGQLAESLVRRGCHVRCLVRSTSVTDRLRALGAELVQGELHDLRVLRRAMLGVDAVFHIAGLTAAASMSSLMRVNAAGVECVARACALRPEPPVHVLVSSIAAAGPVRRGALRGASDPASPVSNYGRSKRAGERMAENWAQVVPTTIVRPGVVYGPRNRDLLPVFRGIDRARVHIVPTYHWPPISWIHVEDLAEILIRAATCGERVEPRVRERSGQGCYFACHDEYPDYARMGRLISQVLGHRHTFVLTLCDPLPWLIGGISQCLGMLCGRPSILNVDKIREATASSWACSTEAVRAELGFAPPPLSRRLRETALWYREQGWL